jgi:hypothetical protein
LFTSLGISTCTFIRFVPLRAYGLYLVPNIVWARVVINGALVIVIIDWGIATQYNGTNFTCSILKLEVHA